MVLTHETVRRWCREFGQPDADGPRRRRPRTGDTWHLDEVFISINGQTHSLWRAVDQDGTVLDILVHRRRDTRAAVRFLRTLLSGLQYVLRVLITDTLAGYGAAKRELLPSGGGGGSRAPGTRNASSPPTAPSPATSDPATTA